MIETVVLDVDGTLVDSNYQHTLAWYRAFRRRDLTVPAWRIHRAIGMGGDQLVTALCGADVEHAHGDELRSAWTQEYTPMLAEVRPLEGATDLLTDLRSRGLHVVLASSGAQEQVDHYLGLLDGRRLAQGWTTSDDVEASKPHPDLLQVALDKVDGDPANAVMIGDSTWDAVAAAKLGLRTLAVRTGGFSIEELKEAGAEEVFDALPDLQRHLARLTAGPHPSP